MKKPKSRNCKRKLSIKKKDNFVIVDHVTLQNRNKNVDNLLSTKSSKSTKKIKLHPIVEKEQVESSLTTKEIDERRDEYCRVCDKAIPLLQWKTHSEGKRHQRALKTNKSLDQDSKHSVSSKIQMKCTIQKQENKTCEIPMKSTSLTFSRKNYKIDCSDHDLEVWVYYILETIAKKQVVVFATKDSLIRRVSGILKTLQINVLAIHNKTTKTQKQIILQKFGKSMVLICKEETVKVFQWENAGALHLDSPVSEKSRNIRFKIAPQDHYFLVVPVNDNTLSSCLEVEKLTISKIMLERLRSRVRLAEQIDSLSSVLRKEGSDSIWASKMARAAGFDDEEETLSVVKSQKMEKLCGLSSKLAILLAQPLECTRKINVETTKLKMKLLGLLPDVRFAADNGGIRISAQTKWIDGAIGPWQDDIRHGASCDDTSLHIRKMHEKWMFSQLPDSSYPAKGWNPNPEPSNEDWGGKWGKPCGHNEVVMHFLRPFVPQEVLNSRICSRIYPAPGNDGFDGCLEHLQLHCKYSKRSMNIWDISSFHYIDELGRHHIFDKRKLLIFSSTRLKFLMKNLREHTIFFKGTRSSLHLLHSISWMCFYGASSQDSLLFSLPCHLRRRILEFTISDNYKTWIKSLN